MIVKTIRGNLLGTMWTSSIIILQKVAAMVDKVAADLGLMASKVRWLLHKKYLDFAASSAAIFLCTSIYYSNAVFSAFW